MKSRGLGKGLNELLMGDSIVESKAKKSLNKRKVSDKVEIEKFDGRPFELNIDNIEAGRYQPRKDLQEDENLLSLAESIKSQGVIQPIIVKKNSSNFYEIIAGERRWRASKLAGLKTIPAIVKNSSEKDMMAMALIENIQREDLSLIEQASALNRLADEFNLSQTELSSIIGKPRTTIVNIIRLLTLHEEVKKMLDAGEIEFGHAKVLLGLKGPLQLKAALEVVERGLNVKQTERLVNELSLSKSKSPSKKEISADVENLEIRLSEAIGAPVHIFCNKKGKGKLTLSYSSLDELDNIISFFEKES